jgi:hypothetical protein
MKTIQILAFFAAIVLAGCGRSDSTTTKEAASPSAAATPTPAQPVGTKPAQSADTKVSEQKLDMWPWLSKTSKHDAEVAQIPKNTQIEIFIPKDEPLNAESVGYGMKIDPYGNLTPIDKKSYIVKGGALVSKLGPIEKKAEWGDWDFVYEDASHTKKAGWGECLTSGEILLPRNWYGGVPTNFIVQNSYEIESFGDDYVLIHLDPTKGHRLCVFKSGVPHALTAGYIGSKAEVDGKTLERKADGWYSGTTRVSR